MNTPSQDTEITARPARSVTVYVNTKPYEVNAKERITYEQVVTLAALEVSGGVDVTYTVTFRRGRGSKPSGTLVAGGSAMAKEGMVFDVTLTTRS